MQVTVNGKVQDVGTGVSLLGFLDESGLSAKTVVVERNGEIIPGDEFEKVELEEGDVLEVLRFVGGG